MKAGRSISCVIFDMDGVLLDTEPFYTQASAAICDRYGCEFTWAHKSQMVGRPNPDAAAYLVAALGLPLSAEEFLRERASILDALFPAAEPMPGAMKLTSHLYAYGVPHAVASSSMRRTFELKTGSHGEWFSRFNQIVLGDDPGVCAGKPAPDIFLLAAQRMGMLPEHCLVIEDAPAGIAAARAAGMAVVAVPDSNMDSALFTSADSVLASLCDFDPEVWGLPPFLAVSDLEAVSGS